MSVVSSRSEVNKQHSLGLEFKHVTTTPRVCSVLARVDRLVVYLLQTLWETTPDMALELISKNGGTLCSMELESYVQKEKEMCC